MDMNNSSFCECSRDARCGKCTCSWEATFEMAQVVSTFGSSPDTYPHQTGPHLLGPFLLGQPVGALVGEKAEPFGPYTGGSGSRGQLMFAAPSGHTQA